MISYAYCFLSHFLVTAEYIYYTSCHIISSLKRSCSVFQWVTQCSNVYSYGMIGLSGKIMNIKKKKTADLNLEEWYIWEDPRGDVGSKELYKC